MIDNRIRLGARENDLPLRVALRSTSRQVLGELYCGQAPNGDMGDGRVFASLGFMAGFAEHQSLYSLRTGTGNFVRHVRSGAVTLMKPLPGSGKGIRAYSVY